MKKSSKIVLFLVSGIFILAIFIPPFRFLAILLASMLVGGLLLMVPFAIPFFLLKNKKQAFGKSDFFLKLSIGIILGYFTLSFVTFCIFKGEVGYALFLPLSGLAFLPFGFLISIGLYFYDALSVPTSINRWIFLFVFLCLSMFASWMLSRKVLQIDHSFKFICYDRQIDRAGYHQGDMNMMKYFRNTAKEFLFSMVPL